MQLQEEEARDGQNIIMSGHQPSESSNVAGGPNVCYCPSRWLMAYHDPKANIFTMSSHMCLADLNNEGENLLALIDFKQKMPANGTATKQKQQPVGTQPPYDCRLRVYRGQQLIYNHFLEDMPSCLIATTIRGPPAPPQVAGSMGSNRVPAAGARDEAGKERALLSVAINDDVYFYHKLKPSHRLSLEDEDRIMESLNRTEFELWQMVRRNKVEGDVETMRELLVSISNEFGPNELTSHSNNFLALETNEERNNYLLLWKFKRLSNGQGEHLMSMDTICCSAARLKYTSCLTRSGDFGQTREAGGGFPVGLLSGSLVSGGGGSGGVSANQTKWNRLIDLQKDGLVVGTEDKHLLIYELRLTRSILETHYRLPSTPDHILVERRSPATFDTTKVPDVKNFTYKILISCRNCRIYSLDQSYILDSSNSNSKQQPRELLALKCNVIDMCWLGDDDDHDASPINKSEPSFVAACLDRRVYCYGSGSGQCKWVIETELPITCIVSFPIATGNQRQRQSQSHLRESRCLIGVASQANRIDFHLSLTGRIVDSIYFNGQSVDDHCQAMAFGRFGREDNCLCLTTKLGHLLIFILKRAAKFAHGQCLSSAASHASAMLAQCSHLLINSRQETGPASSSQQQMRLNEAPKLPSAFNLAKSSNVNPTDQAIELLQAEHSCDQVQVAKESLDAHLAAPQLQVHAKSRDFVDQIVEQSRHSTAMSRVFAKQMVKLRDKIRTTIEQQSDLALGPGGQQEENGNKITLTRIIGLGNTYRASLSLRLNLSRFVDHDDDDAQVKDHHHLLSGGGGGDGDEASGAPKDPTGGNRAKLTRGDSIDWTRGTRFAAGDPVDSNGANQQTGSLVILLFVANKQQHQQCQVRPFSFQLAAQRSARLAASSNCCSSGAPSKGQWIFEKTIDFKLLTGPINVAPSSPSIGTGQGQSAQVKQQQQQPIESESVSLDVEGQGQGQDKEPT